MIVLVIILFIQGELESECEELTLMLLLKFALAINIYFSSSKVRVLHELWVYKFFGYMYKFFRYTDRTPVKSNKADFRVLMKHSCSSWYVLYGHSMGKRKKLEKCEEDFLIEIVKHGGVQGGTHGQILLRACIVYISYSEPDKSGSLPESSRTNPTPDNFVLHTIV